MVFIHGFPLRRILWEPQLRGLGQRCRCIAPDLRGFGESEVRGPYSMDRYADDVVELLDALSIPRAVIVGHSMGGYVTFALWRRHPDRVSGLVLTDTRPRADDEAGLAKRRDMMRAAREHGSGAVADAMIDGMLGRSTRRRCPELVQDVHAMLASAPVEGVIGAIEAMMARPDSVATLPSIDVPTLIVVGEEDAITPVRDSEAMGAAIAGSRLEIIPGAGHMASLERPAAFNAVLGEFLDGLSGGAGD